MKKLAILFIMAIACPLWADDIHLNDGTIVKGKIIRITDKYVEYDPEGEKQYDFFPRGQISKIIYEGGNVTVLNEIPNGRPEARIKNAKAYAGTNIFLEIEWGWNGYVGFGPRIDWRIFGPLSINAGAGIGLWGQKVAGGLRYYSKYPYGFALGLGVGYNTGGKLEPELKTVDASGAEESEKVELDLRPATVINATLLYSWKLGSLGKIYIEGGYGFPVQRNRYRYSTASGNTLSRESRDFISTISPGGTILSIGYAFAL